MATDRRPGWWGVYTLVPLMGGLLMLEHGASVSPAGHKFAQIVIVVCIYGLVWIWLRANTLALLHVAYNTHEKTYVDEANWAARPLRPYLIPRRAYVRKTMAHHTNGYAKTTAYRMETSKCSLS